MELKQIKELMAAMEKAGMTKLRLKEKGGFEIELERQGELPHSYVSHAPIVHHHAPVSTHPHPHFPSEKEESHSAKEVEGTFVTSPMVGTFYASPSPDDPMFVRVGDQVNENTVVCIIEAMKVMNEVKAGQKGQVAEILIESGHPVEFGTKLFRII